MTSPDPKEGAALPDVWIAFDDQRRPSRLYSGKMDWSVRYTPASRVQELTERLERAVVLLHEWKGHYYHDDYTPIYATDVFLAAHKEPKP